MSFAELGEYLHQPVRTYSSGMAMRLGFTVAMMSNPEIMILDEVLAVGDQHFQKKCMDRIRDIRKSGTTILFVSHSVYHVRQMCDEAIWLHEGQVVMHGKPVDVTDEYVNFQYALSGGQSAIVEQKGGRGAFQDLPHLTDVRINRAGSTTPETKFAYGDEMEIHVGWRDPKLAGPHHVGIIVYRNDDIMIFGSSTDKDVGPLRGHEGRVVARIPISMLAGEYYLSVYLVEENREHVVDQRLSWAPVQGDVRRHREGHLPARREVAGGRKRRRRDPAPERVRPEPLVRGRRGGGDRGARDQADRPRPRCGRREQRLRTRRRDLRPDLRRDVPAQRRARDLPGGEALRRGAGRGPAVRRRRVRLRDLLPGARARRGPGPGGVGALEGGASRVRRGSFARGRARERQPDPPLDRRPRGRRDGVPPAMLRGAPVRQPLLRADLPGRLAPRPRGDAVPEPHQPPGPLRGPAPRAGRGGERPAVRLRRPGAGRAQPLLVRAQLSPPGRRSGLCAA